MQLDDWQWEYIRYKGDKVLVSGRQTGKSEAQAYDNAEFAADPDNFKKWGDVTITALLISKTERQAEELLIKTVLFLQEYHPELIAKDKDHKMTKHCVWLRHGKDQYARVMCLPTGLAGEGIRGMTIHKLSVDEAQLPEEAVYMAVTPMLVTTGGKTSLTGTPRPQKNFFRKACENKLGHWKVFHVNSEVVLANRPLSRWWTAERRAEALAHLAREKERMTEKQYRQEYLGEFVDDLDQQYPDELIEKVCCIDIKDARKMQEEKVGSFYIGVDVGRTVDPSTFQVLNGRDADNIVQVESVVKKRIHITQTSDEVLRLNEKYNARGIGVDGGGLGAGVFDILLRESSVKRKISDLNNSRRDLDKDGKRKKSLLKEDMHMNLKQLMEKGKIKLLNDEAVKKSLQSCIIEYREGHDQPEIYGDDTHIAEGLIRAAWMVKEKGLRLFCFYN